MEAIQGVLAILNAIHEAAKNVRAVPKNAKKLAEQAERCRNRIKTLEKHRELHDHIEKYIGGLRHELLEVQKFLLALEGKNKLRRWVQNKNIKDAFKDFHQRLQECRDELNADIIAFLAAAPSNKTPVASPIDHEMEVQLDEEELDPQRNQELKKLIDLELNGSFSLASKLFGRFQSDFRSTSTIGKGVN